MQKGLILLLPCLALQAYATITNEEILAKVQGLEKVIQKLQAENTELKSASADIQSQNVHLEKEYQTRKLSGAYVAYAVDSMWLLICGALVMFMQAGFAMLEAGTCRMKNVQNILMKNMVDVCVGTFCWYSIGWTLAYGFVDDKDQGFAGTLQYFGHEFMESDSDGNQKPVAGKFRDWFFQWAFCSAAATIVSGGVAERVQFPGYVIYTICMTGVIYPVVVAWTWGGGWLSGGTEKYHMNDVGFNDFAGSGIVHMTGGVGALVGALAVGPRKGRFDGSDESFDPHSLPLCVLGTLILWFGWYGFNCGSTLGMTDAGLKQADLAAICAMNTTLAAAAGGIMVLILRGIINKKYDLGGMCNGVLAGLVSITAGCGNVEGGSAVVIGILGGFVYQGASSLLVKLKVDDPLDAFAVHGACGAWGVLAACLFDWGAGFSKYNGFGGGLDNVAASNPWVKGFAAAVVEIVMVLVWSGGLSALIFFPLRMIGLLRASDNLQEEGMDTAKHAPPMAYEIGEPRSPRSPKSAKSEGSGGAEKPPFCEI